jgi:hypothetical protein
MSCIEIGVLWLSVSLCHPDPAYQRLPGVWVGTLESGAGLKLMRAEFVRGRSGLTGVVHLEGTGDLTLLRAGESSRRVYLQTGTGADEFVFVGGFREGSIVGRADHAGKHSRFELHVDPSSRAAWPGPTQRRGRL